MPGMNLIHYFSNGGVRPAPEISRVLTSVGMPDDPIQTLIEDRFYHLSCKAYPGYPFVFWGNNLFYFYLEGYLYGLSQKEMQTALEYLAEVIFLQDKNTNRISAWVSNTDGDFLIWMGDKKNGRSAIINDLFGRLPVYYMQSADEVLVSRDVRFITNVCGQSKFDRLGVAQQLMMGHGMGELTPWQAIHRLNPASLLTIDPLMRRVSLRTLYSFNFSSKKYRNVKAEENAGRLVELFRQACTTRAGLSAQDVVSLSGGLDSRSVAAGLASSGRLFTAVTFYKAAYQKREESQIARTVANLLDSPFHLIEVREATAPAVLKLLRLKNGQNNLGMAFLIEFFDNIRARLGPDSTYFTGEFGDRALPFIRAAWPLTSLKSLTHYILDSNYHDNFCLKIEDVAALTGIRREDLVESIADHLAGYPEESWADKNLHYKIYDRAFRVYNEAEDRNRCYFWSVAPFFA
ncbi:MAG: asparagine synthase-related protein, partial [Deltaproteobacteria bacterium]|nr:asparagine synthase-related protein [Deltaproteobacteria bacterium]